MTFLVIRPVCSLFSVKRCESTYRELTLNIAYHITGSDPVLVIENGKLTEYHAKVLPKESIVDTNGAGDAFVGGFLAKLAEGKSIQSCVLCGIWAATEIIQQSGCTCPDDKTYTE